MAPEWCGMRARDGLGKGSRATAYNSRSRKTVVSSAPFRHDNLCSIFIKRGCPSCLLTPRPPPLDVTLRCGGRLKASAKYLRNSPADTLPTCCLDCLSVQDDVI
ncbi:hypothetical protein E2C01_048094 [Portunus trituberculatus]|uniref:Uncharacterized protein n=1 Tax=Portunus trituberculatus TaxID=210409 RepID=A0A5B7G9M5_PORTR|nr:hypothetical protein [Portunus trituberculatus]